MYTRDRVFVDSCVGALSTPTIPMVTPCECELGRLLAETHRRLAALESAAHAIGVDAAPSTYLEQWELNIESAFNRIDVTGEGHLSRMQVIAACRRDMQVRELLGGPRAYQPDAMCREAFEAAIHRLDRDGSDDRITIDRFLRLFGRSALLATMRDAGGRESWEKKSKSLMHDLGPSCGIEHAQLLRVPSTADTCSLANADDIQLGGSHDGLGVGVTSRLGGVDDRFGGAIRTYETPQAPLPAHDPTSPLSLPLSPRTCTSSADEQSAALRSLLSRTALSPELTAADTTDSVTGLRAAPVGVAAAAAAAAAGVCDETASAHQPVRTSLRGFSHRITHLAGGWWASHLPESFQGWWHRQALLEQTSEGGPPLGRPPLSRPPLSRPPLSRPPLSRPSHADACARDSPLGEGLPTRSVPIFGRTPSCAASTGAPQPEAARYEARHADGRVEGWADSRVGSCTYEQAELARARLAACRARAEADARVAAEEAAAACAAVAVASAMERHGGEEATSAEIAAELSEGGGACTELAQISARVSAITRRLSSASVAASVVEDLTPAPACGAAPSTMRSAPCAAPPDAEPPPDGPYTVPASLSECVALLELENHLLNERFFNRLARA